MDGRRKRKKLAGPVIARKNIIISGMHCGHCVQSVTDSLNQIDGVSARVDLSKGCAEISLDREVGEDILTAAVERAGFSVESIQSLIVINLINQKCAAGENGDEQRKRKRLL